MKCGLCGREAGGHRHTSARSEQSISLPLFACWDKFVVRNIRAESQSSMQFHLLRGRQLFTTELQSDGEIRKHKHIKSYSNSTGIFFLFIYFF